MPVRGSRMTAIRGKRNAYHHGDLPAAIKAATISLIAAKGVSGFTLREAARLAGVTHAAPYRHFEDKNALLAEIAVDGFNQLSASITAAADAAGPEALPRLLAMGPAYVRFASEHPTYFRLMWGPDAPDKSSYEELAAADREAFSILTEAVRRAQDAGQIVPGHPDHLALAAWTLIHGFAHALVGGDLERRGSSPEEIQQLHARGAALFLNGVLPR